MKILRVIGLALAILLLKFVLLKNAFSAFEGALISFFGAFEVIFKGIEASPFLGSFP